MIYYIVEADDRGRVLWESGVKIGFTGNDPQARLKQLQTGNPNQLAIYALEPGERSHEAKIHNRFKHLSENRGGREWFRADPELRAWMSTLRTIYPEYNGRGPSTVIVSTKAGKPRALPMWRWLVGKVGL